jgi:hypothetical protein
LSKSSKQQSPPTVKLNNHNFQHRDPISQSNMPSSTTNDFFAQVETKNLPTEAGKKQPWKEFHEPNEELMNSGSVEVEIPKSDENGIYPILAPKFQIEANKLTHLHFRWLPWPLCLDRFPWRLLEREALYLLSHLLYRRSKRLQVP